MATKNVEWSVLRHVARIRVWATEGPDGWRFLEKEVGDVRWFPLNATPELVAEAGRQCAGTQGDPTAPPAIYLSVAA